jgi:hypothetical protein
MSNLLSQSQHTAFLPKRIRSAGAGAKSFRLPELARTRNLPVALVPCDDDVDPTKNQMVFLGRGVKFYPLYATVTTTMEAAIAKVALY